MTGATFKVLVAGEAAGTIRRLDPAGRAEVLEALRGLRTALKPAGYAVTRFRDHELGGAPYMLTTPHYALYYSAEARTITVLLVWPRPDLRGR